jgi:hypothetical protein
MVQTVRRHIGRAALVPLAILAFAAGPVSQERDYVRTHYRKSEYRIPMRDGAKLFTAVYVPNDTSRTYPILLNRTPYSVAPYGADHYPDTLGPSELFAREGYIFVYQDVRGRLMSEGEFVNMRPHLAVKRGPADIDESTDAYDTIDWLIKNVPNHNGCLGMYGISYPGFYSSAGMIDAHPALRAVSPQAPISDWFIGDDFHHNGALYLPHAFNFLATFGRPRPKPTTSGSPSFNHGTDDGFTFFLDLGPMPNADAKYFKGDVPFWLEMMQHETYDTFWQARNLRPHLKNIGPAVMTVGGWFDAEDLFGALETYKWTERQSPGASNILVMGPWYHGGWARSDGEFLGDVRFGSKTAVFYREKMELPFFEAHLKGKGDPALPEAYVFETGANRWRTFDEWPPKTATPVSLYLGAGGRLSLDAPDRSAASPYDEYASDPGNPVPYINHTAIGMTREHMVDDQRFAARRKDVLVYQTEPLAAEMTVAGPITATLMVSTSGTDSDWIVKVIDVYPDAEPAPSPSAEPALPQPSRPRMALYQQLVRAEPMRGKFRNSFEKPEPFEPGAVTKVEWTMPDVFHAFRKGHRIMVQVQSTWFPLVNLNPQTFVNVNTAKASDFRKAVQRVYHAPGQASKVTVSLLKTQ